MRKNICLIFVFLSIMPIVSATNSELVPEFSTITAGIALIGAMIGYKLLKNKKVM